jgi:hypothetical protein
MTAFGGATAARLPGLGAVARLEAAERAVP